jgi:hypothetical protein
MYENIYGLSCVENHVISQLRKAGVDERGFYCDSIISSKILYDDLITGNKSAFDYPRIPRVQNQCKRLGILSLKKYTISSDFLPVNDKIYLIRVTPRFNKEILRSRAFRPDHYVILERHNEKLFSLQNDIPERRLTIDNFQLQEAYDGDFFVLEIKRPLFSVEENELIQRGIKNIYQLFGNSEPIAECIDRPISYIQMRGFLYLTKQLRNRSKQFLEKKIDTSRLSDILFSYEKTLSFFEYSRLRKKDLNQTIRECIIQINTLDIAYYQIVQEMLENDNRISYSSNYNTNVTYRNKA